MTQTQTDLRFRVHAGAITFTFVLDNIEEDNGDEGHLDRAHKFLAEDVRAGVPVYDERGNAWVFTPDTRIDALALLPARQEGSRPATVEAILGALDEAIEPTNENHRARLQLGHLRRELDRGRDV